MNIFKHLLITLYLVVGVVFYAEARSSESILKNVIEKEFYYEVNEIDLTTGMVSLTNGANITIAPIPSSWFSWGTSIKKILDGWTLGQCVRMEWDPTKKIYFFNNLDINSRLDGELKWTLYEEIKDISDDLKTIVFESGWVFSLTNQSFPVARLIDKIIITKVGDQFWFVCSKNSQGLPTESFLVDFCGYLEQTDELIDAPIDTPVDDTPMECLNRFIETLNERIIGQPEVSEYISSAFINGTSDLRDSPKPFGVFLFLGPAGVGKTECAKVIGKNLFYPEDHLVYSDMSQQSPDADSYFTGGASSLTNQLINALNKQSNIVFVLDKIEKPETNDIYELLTNVFDNGYIFDKEGDKHNCSDSMFILISNLCATEISKLFEEGYTGEQILEMIKPTLMNELSPELYDQVQPILFNPITPEMTATIMDRFLNDLAERLLNKKKVTVLFDQSVKDYLMSNGYSTDLGVHLLKKIIDKQIVPALSRIFFKQNIAENSTLTLFYSQFDKEWILE